MENLESDHMNLSPIYSKISMLISGSAMGHVGLLVSFFETKYPVYTIVLLRGIFGTLFLTIFLLKTKSLSFRLIKEYFKLHLAALIIMGIVNPLIIFFYFINITISGYSLAAFLLYTGGIFSILFLFITKEEKISRINLLSFLFATVGVAIIMEFWTGNVEFLGIIYGILSGITLGILIFYKKKVYNKRDREDLPKGVNLDIFLAWWPSLFTIVMFLPLGTVDLLKFDFIDLIFSLILGLFPTAIAFVLYNVGVKNDKGGNVIILSYVEPLVATIWSVVLLQRISIFTIIGGSFIILANIIAQKYTK